jgi:hypothetical protein
MDNRILDYKYKITTLFHLQNINIRHNSTGQYKTKQYMTKFKMLNKFCICTKCLVDKRLFWYFRQLVRRIKSCPVVQWGTRI